MFRYYHYLIEKSLNAGDAVYIDNDEANDQIEKMKIANQDLLVKVADLSSLVKDSISKTKEVQLTRRKKQRDQVFKSFSGDVDFEDKEVKDIIKEKK